MYNNSNFRLTHKADLYAMTRTTNDVGQEFASWTLQDSNVRCFYAPPGRVTTIRTLPTIEESEYFGLIFPSDTTIDYTTRIYNIKDIPKGNVIVPGPLQVVYIYRHPSYTGKLQFLHVRCKSVIEE